MTPYGNGWHLDRKKFDVDLRRRCSDAGTVLLQNTDVTKLEFVGIDQQQGSLAVAFINTQNFGEFGEPQAIMKCKRSLANG